MLTPKQLETESFLTRMSQKNWKKKKKDDSVLFPVALIEYLSLGEKDLTIAGYKHA